MNKINRDINNIIKLYLLPSIEFVKCNKTKSLNQLYNITGNIRIWSSIDKHKKFVPHSILRSEDNSWFLNMKKIS